MSPTRVREPALSIALKSGVDVNLRPLEPSDAPGLEVFLNQLSPDARRTRFFVAMPEIGRRLVTDLIEVDPCRHMVWGAFLGDRMVGEVRSVIHRDDPTVAEVAFAVADDLRRIGLGRVLVETIGVASASRGIETLVASVLPDNRASTAMLRGLGMSFRFADGALEGSGPVPPWTGTISDAQSIVELQQRSMTCSLTPAA